MRVLVGEGGQEGGVGGGRFIQRKHSQKLRARRPFLREGTVSCTGNLALASEP